MNTRRKTRPGRLRRLDAFLARREAALLARPGPLVDVGIGAVPWTTCELAEAFPDHPVIAVDHDADLVARAAPHPRVTFRVGGFDLPVRGALVVRAMNVLRDYRPEDVAPAHARLGAALVDGGLLVEGTSSPQGEVLCAWLVRRTGDALLREGLLFSTDFSQGFAPMLFRDRLPRDVRAGGNAVHAFLRAWSAVVGEGDAHDRFVRSAAALPDVEADPVGWAEGALVWRPAEREFAPSGAPG